VFSLGGHRMTCHIDRIGEILSCPQSTSVPGAKPWIIGLANVRGELLTVVDLAWYLGGTPSKPGPGSRLLCASLAKAPIGLLVDEVLGQRHFLDSDALAAELDDDSPLRGVVMREHRLGADTWYELDLDRLFTSPEFLHGAAD
jgi:twitching motility protein PilI